MSSSQPMGSDFVDPNEVRKLVSKAAKMTNANYRAVVDGDAPSRSQREARRKQQQANNAAFLAAEYGPRFRR